MNNSPKNLKNNNKTRKQGRITLSPLTLTLIIIINVFILGFFGWLILQQNFNLNNSTQISSSPSEGQNQPLLAPSTQTSNPTGFEPNETQEPLSLPVEVIHSSSGIMVISLSEAGFFHLFAYHPENFPLTRLTFGEWDDIHPAVSPDGSKIAFSSHRNGQWDLHILNLGTGELIQVTDDKAYDGSPSWSGDGKQLAFEKYVKNNLDIYIISTDGGSQVIRATTNTAQDFSPAWNPVNSQIAFTSNRSNANNVWIIDADQIGNNPLNFTFNNSLDQHSPSWSPDGQSLAWISPFEGYESIFISDQEYGSTSARYVGSGNQATWDPNGDIILTSIQTPDQSFLTGYHQQTGSFIIPPISLSGRIQGISWGAGDFGSGLPRSLQSIAKNTPQAPWSIALTPTAGDLYGRQYTVDLPDVRAPNPALNGLAIEPFFALRNRINIETGWDVLSDLENAFVPLTQPLPPERSNDWLYTGRAFSLNPVLLDLDWMKVVREDFGAKTYWRVYIKTRYQDGSQGKPMTQIPWDFDARFSGNTSHYEQGGALEATIPAGYWIDFTKIAFEYGWERHPALSNWQRYYHGSRFNTFAITSGLDWEDAMLQLWPPEVFLGPSNP